MADWLADNTNDVKNEYPVYLGVWTNWSRGPIMGKTVTMSRQDANLLIAFLGFIIAFVATRVWRILCFSFHRHYSRPKSQTALYHQHQAILRNASSPEDGLRLLLQLFWAWRNSPQRFLPIPTLLVAIFCISGFIVASGFSSRVSTAVGDEVLVKPDNCGYLPVQAFSDDNNDLLATKATYINDISNYAQQCYSRNETGLLDCRRFVSQRLPGEANQAAECPFTDSICRKTSANLRLDTGYIDTNDHLGMNAPTDQRIRWRNVLHCAPLVTDGYTTQENTTSGNLTYYHYGTAFNGENKAEDYVYVATAVDSQYNQPYTITYANYQLE
jgi:hypothetical protein